METSHPQAQTDPGSRTARAELPPPRGSRVHLTPHDFEPAVRTVNVHAISRPSLSYWQDAWLRLCKNKQAILALGLVIFMVLFAVVGPFLWQVDPSAVSTGEISRAPTLRSGSAVAISDQDTFEPITVKDLPKADVNSSSDLRAPGHLSFIGVPNTNTVRLKWDPVPGATSYLVYRSDEPVKEAEYGLPLNEIQDPSQVSYEDQLNLEPVTYYYTVIASLNGSESPRASTIHATLAPAMVLSDTEMAERNIRPGQLVRTAAHPMGTDYLGRDLLARLMTGARVSLFIGFFAPLLYIFLGILIGGFSGYYGGRIDMVMTRFTDLVLALPFLLFMILFRIAFGVQPGESGIFPLLVAMIALSWTSSAKLVRGQVMQLREAEYVQAARLLGASPFYLLLRHLIPNTMGVILVYLTFAIPSAIFTEAFLSFIGMGVAPPTPSWGSMCDDGIRSLLSHPHEFIFPAVMISITVLAFNLLGDGLRDALDPKLRSSG